MNILEFFNKYLAMIPYADKIPYSVVVLPVLVAVVCVIFAFHGKRLLNLLKFLVCAGAGYYVGSTILYTYVGAYLAPHGITALIVGIVLAVVLLLLSKFAYAIVFAGALGYAAYLLIPMYVVAKVPALANPVYLIVAAVAVGVVALIFRGFFETVLTAVGGAFGFTGCLYTAAVAVTGLLGLGANGTGLQLNNTMPVVGPLTFETVVVVVVTVIIAFFGFIKQVKNRHMY